MEPQPPANPGSRRWPGRLAGGLVVAAFAGLVVWGLAWGVPSERRARLEGASEQVRRLKEELVRQSWQHWGSHGRKSEVGEEFPRNLFNPVRSYHPDEYQVFKSLSNMRPGRLSFDPGNYIYPSLHTYLVGAALGACSVVGVVHLERNLGYYFDHPDEMGRMYLVGRALTLLAAVGTLLLIWRLGERMGRGVGLLAMAMAAAAPVLMVHSHSLTRDTLAALAAIVLFACCRRLAQTGTARWYDWSGAAAGLCVGCQYFAVVLWGLVPLAGVMRLRKGDPKRQVATGVLVSLVVMAAVFFLTSPYQFLNFHQFVADFASETGHVGQGGILAKIASFGWASHIFKMLPDLATWPMAVAVCAGILVALVRREEDDWLLLGWLVLWAGVVGFDGRSYSRYYVPLLAGLALMGARGLVWAAGRLGAGRGRAAALGVAAAVALVPAAGVSWAWARLYAQENVRTMAGEWIWAHVPAGSRIGVTQWPWQFEMPPIDPDRYRLVVLEAAGRGSPYDVALLEHLAPDYFVTSSLQSGSMEARGQGESREDRFWRFLLESKELYRVAEQFDEPLRLLGWRIGLSGFPEDMRYVNPRIVLLERELREARAGGDGGGE